MSDKPEEPTSDSGYILPWDETEIERLDLQHRMITQVYDNLLVAPRIRLQPASVALDCACGTGIWGVELASQEPSYTVHCSDLSKHAFPSPSTVPSNAHFSTDSVFALPPSWSNKFDIIYQRLMLGMPNESQWLELLAEIFRVTKPGGWIQLVEVDYSMTVAQGLEKLTPATNRLFYAWHSVFLKNGLVWETGKHLPGLIEKTGFVNATKDTRICSLEGGNIENAAHGSLADKAVKVNYLLFKSAKKSMMQVIEVTGEEFDQLTETMKGEWKDLPKSEKGVGTWWHMFCAQKPTN
jgi:ubiquinone/menaquinone biosynthesis C-methylase UbiE